MLINKKDKHINEINLFGHSTFLCKMIYLSNISISPYFLLTCIELSNISIKQRLCTKNTTLYEHHHILEPYQYRYKIK